MWMSIQFGPAIIKRNDKDAIEFDYGWEPCNFICQNSGFWLASLKTGFWTCLHGWFQRSASKGACLNDITQVK